MGGNLDEKDRLLDALELLPVDRMPCACPLQTGTVDLMEASGASWPAANHDPSLMARLSRSAHDVAGIESVRVPFDVVVDAEAFGAVTGMEGLDRQPAVLEKTITSLDDVDAVDIPDPTANGRAPVVLEAVRLLADGLPSTPVICAVVSPFMLTGQLRGIEETLMEILAGPELIKEILDLTTEWNVAFSLAALEAGADVIAMIDATASGDILGPGHYAEFALPYQKRVAGAVNGAGGHSVLHICGRTTENMTLMLSSRAHGISVDQQMDIGWVKQVVRGRTAVVGNVSPTSTLLFKGPEDVIAESGRCINAGVDILAPGCGFAPWTPLDNMRAMVQVARHYKP